MLGKRCVYTSKVRFYSNCYDLQEQIKWQSQSGLRVFKKIDTWFTLDKLVRHLFTQLLVQNINHRTKQNYSSWNVTCKSKLLILKKPEKLNVSTTKKNWGTLTQSSYNDCGLSLKLLIEMLRICHKSTGDILLPGATVFCAGEGQFS